MGGEPRPPASTDNNGNLRRSKVYVPLDPAGAYNGTVAGPHYSAQQTYSYDALNRLESVTEAHNNTQNNTSAAPYTQFYNYDRWGNRTINPATTDGLPEPPFSVDTATNRLLAPGDLAYAGADNQGRKMRYDGAGNLIHDAHTGAGARTYDAENRMTTAIDNTGNAAYYTYDTDGPRVKRKIGNEEWWQVYGMDGELLAEYAAGAAPFLAAKEYGYRGGELLVTMSSGDTDRLRRFVKNLYYNCLARDPSASELQQKMNDMAQAGAQGGETQLLTAHSIARGLFESTEYVNRNRTTGQYVTDLYNAYLQRGPDADGLNHWINNTNQNGRAATLDAFRAATEYRELAGTLYRETFWLVSDHLGTPRMVVNRTGSPAVIKRHDYLPFGEELLANSGGRTTAQGYVSLDNVRQRFTGKERDDETGLDYSGARHYSSTQGRFTGADDIFKDSQVGDPQSWNKYVYVRNNPLKYVDPTGEKALISLSIDEQSKRGIITIKATFAVYAANGNRMSARAVAKEAERLQKQLTTAWSTKKYERNGINYEVKVEFTATAYSSESAAEAAGNAGKVDNIVGIVDAPMVTTPDGDTAGGYAGRLAGEKFDRVRLSTGALKGNETAYAHESTHLFGNRDYNVPGNVSNTYPEQQTQYATTNDYDLTFGARITAWRTFLNKNNVTSASSGFEYGFGLSYRWTPRALGVPRSWFK